MNEKLSPKHQEFIRQYLSNGFNATEAYRTVYPSCKDPDSAGPRLLGNVRIQSEIKKAQEETRKKFDLKQDDVLNSLMAIAFFDPMSVLEWKGDSLVYKKNFKESLIGTNFSIYPEYQSKDDKRKKILRAKLSIQSGDRKGALELLGKHIGMWKDKDAGQGTDSESQRDVIKRVHELFRKRRERARGNDDSKT